MRTDVLELESLLEPVGDPERRDEWAAYLRYHARRYAVLLNAVRDSAGAGAGRILNVGPMFETAILRQRFAGWAVDTLGFPHPLFPPRAGERHIDTDLNEVDSPDAPEPDGSYDAIVMAEVIEHLHTAPSIVLRHLGAWLRPGGGLVLQTPNAVALHKRVRMLFGRNPTEPPRESRQNPGHFHEYTVNELRAAAVASGLEVAEVRTANYFGGSGAAKAYGALGRVLPSSLRHGITMSLRRSTDS